MRRFRIFRRPPPFEHFRIVSPSAGINQRCVKSQLRQDIHPEVPARNRPILTKSPSKIPAKRNGKKKGLASASPSLVLITNPVMALVSYVALVAKRSLICCKSRYRPIIVRPYHLSLRSARRGVGWYAATI